MCKGKLFILSAPSGTGKTTLLKKVMADIKGLEFSISHTTRLPRNGEVDGKDYHFVTQEKFEKAITKGIFLEWAEVHGNFYGTSRELINEKQEAGTDVILDIDVQGAAILQEKNVEDAVFVFIAPPSLSELERRLRGRETEEEAVITTRMQNAKKEMNAVNEYDYVIINDEIKQATVMLEAIILAERAKSKRLSTGAPITFNGV